jgi:hypothetical protein
LEVAESLKMIMFYQLFNLVICMEDSILWWGFIIFRPWNSYSLHIFATNCSWIYVSTRIHGVNTGYWWRWKMWVRVSVWVTETSRATYACVSLNIHPCLCILRREGQ